MWYQEMYDRINYHIKSAHLQDELDFSKEDMYHMFSVIIARCFTDLNDRNLMLYPLVDLFNHHPHFATFDEMIEDHPSGSGFVVRAVLPQLKCTNLPQI